MPEDDARRVQSGFEVDDIEGPGGRWADFRDPEGNAFEIKERDRPDG